MIWRSTAVHSKELKVPKATSLHSNHTAQTQYQLSVVRHAVRTDGMSWNISATASRFSIVAWYAFEHRRLTRAHNYISSPQSDFLLR